MTCCNGQIKSCCVSEDCPGDPSLCIHDICNTQGNCQIFASCLSKDCCSEGICSPCGTGGTGGISGFGGIGFY